MPPKRKGSLMTAQNVGGGISNHSPNSTIITPPSKRRAPQKSEINTNHIYNLDIIDGDIAPRASLDIDQDGEALAMGGIDKVNTPLSANRGDERIQRDIESPLRNLGVGISGPSPGPATKPKKSTKSSIAAKKGQIEIKVFKAEQAANKVAVLENNKDEYLGNDVLKKGKEIPADDADVIKNEAARPPPVNSGDLPLPWKGRLGYACLNTYLRFSSPPIFTSRTCRIASIIEHRHPLKDPSQPEHAIRNRPDTTQPASTERGQKYVENLCLANVRDIPKMLRWNHKYGIKFMRLSSEMFPFASHAEYGYKLAPFASEALAEVGRIATELGHRLSTHPGQFTQLGSPRPEVINNSIRDLEYHDEMLSLLRQPGQQDRDTVMILHMGGTFGDKLATLERFKANYRNLSSSIKQRFVLENDDVAWSVHDLLPICEELNIPLCLDFHHHNIIFDSSQVREGTLDVKKVYHRIKATWDRKNIRQKMHYSEPCPEAITGRQRRKHNPRPITLPPCPNDMDLMIEAKDKEQAIFELMRTFKLPGFDTFNNIIPYERNDDNRPLPRRIKKKKTRKEIIAEIEEFGKELSEEEEETKPLIPDEEVGMGGAENRVYWPFGMEEWLRPKKREIKKKSGHEENDDTICKDPTFEDLALGKAIHTYEGEYLSDQMKERLGEANYLVDILKLLEEIKVARGANLVEEIWEDSSDKLAKKAFTPNAALAMSGTASGANGEAPKDLRRGGLPASGRISSQVSKSSTSRRQSSRAKAQNSYIKASGED